MRASVRCPGCRAVSSLEGHAPGSSFACLCGNTLPVPTGMRPKPFRWGCLLLAVIVVLSQLSFAGIAVNFGVEFPRVPTLTDDVWLAKTSAAREQARLLCEAEREHHRKTDRWLAVPPAPPRIPTEPTMAADGRFAALGFTPGKSAWQFFVVPGRDHATCVARAWLDESGFPWTIAFDARTDSTTELVSADAPPVPLEND